MPARGVSSPANEGLKSAAASAAKKPVLNPQRISDGAFLELADRPTGTYVAFCIIAEATQIIGEALIVRLVSTSR